MEILIHVEKKKLDSAYTKAVAEYIKRLSAFCRVKCIYYKDFSKLELQNSSACFRVVPGTDTISSEEFAAKIEELGLSGYSRIEFVVADPATVYDLDIAKFSPFSLSGFTMSIDLTTVVLTEQLYRAYIPLSRLIGRGTVGHLGTLRNVLRNNASV